MISKDKYAFIKANYGLFASWAVWASEGPTPKSNIGDMSVFDLNLNPSLLDVLNPNIIMVGLNYSRSTEKIDFVNFHDKNLRGQDYKLRYAFRDTEFYGAYMTDIIKDFEEKISGKVITYLKANNDFVIENIRKFEDEIEMLGSPDPLIIAFGNAAYDLLQMHLGSKYRIKKVWHYSRYIGMERYRSSVLQVLRGAD